MGYQMLEWSTDDQDRPIALINGRRYSFDEVVHLHDELSRLLYWRGKPASAKSDDAPANSPDVAEAIEPQAAPVLKESTR